MKIPKKYIPIIEEAIKRAESREPITRGNTKALRVKHGMTVPELRSYLYGLFVMAQRIRDEIQP